MKRYGRFLVGLLFVATLFSACAPKDINTKISTMSVQVDTSFDAQTLEELESQAKYIVQGKFQDDATEDLQSEAGIVLYGATVSSFEITKVYKGGFRGRRRHKDCRAVLCGRSGWSTDVGSLWELYAVGCRARIPDVL